MILNLTTVFLSLEEIKKKEISKENKNDTEENKIL